MENTIKSITPTNCPHCKKEIFVEFEMRPTVLNELFTPEQMSDAKAEVLRRLKDIDMDPEKKDGMVDWITNKETVFGPKEVELIIKSIESET